MSVQNSEPARLALRVGSMLGVAALAAADLTCFALNRWENRQLVADGPWVVAQYSEPFGTLVALGSLLAMSLVVWRSLGDPQRPLPPKLRPRVLRVLGACVLGSVLCFEAGMGIQYHTLTGEFRVNAFPMMRSNLLLPAHPDGVCVKVELEHWYAWRLNGTRVYPRLLPLPLADQALMREFAKPSPASCQ